MCVAHRAAGAACRRRRAGLRAAAHALNLVARAAGGPQHAAARHALLLRGAHPPVDASRHVPAVLRGARDAPRAGHVRPVQRRTFGGRRRLRSPRTCRMPTPRLDEMNTTESTKLHSLIFYTNLGRHPAGAGGCAFRQMCVFARGEHPKARPGGSGRGTSRQRSANGEFPENGRTGIDCDLGIPCRP